MAGASFVLLAGFSEPIGWGSDKVCQSGGFIGQMAKLPTEPTMGFGEIDLLTSSIPEQPRGTSQWM